LPQQGQVEMENMMEEMTGDMTEEGMEV